MANIEILTFLQDILDAIADVESFFVDYPMRFDVFEKDYLRRSAVERKAEIMGEAMNRIKKGRPHNRDFKRKRYNRYSQQNHTRL